MPAQMHNMQHIHKFSRTHALLSPLHAQELVSLAAAPRTEDNTNIALAQCAATYGIKPGDGKNFIFAGGIAVIPVWGALLHRDPWCDSYATGYDYIASRFAAAMGDDEVKGVVFDLNSYGGHVSGNFELCQQIYDARGKKPMMSIVDSRALSGGYSLASATGRIVATPSADIGSIGVVMMHMAYEDMLKKNGIDVTFIFAGEHKVDGNPFEKLPTDVRKALEKSVQKSYEQFVALVARNRSLDPEAVRNTEARVYDADEAKSVGLIDDVMLPRDAYTAFLSELSGSTQSKQEKKMSTENQQKEAAAAPAQPAVDTAKLTADAQKAERARVAGITGSDEAKGKSALANHLAMNTDMSVEAAKEVLKAAAEEAPAKEAAAEVPAKKGALDAAMEASGGGAGVGSEGGEGGQKQSIAQRMALAHAKATGREVAKK